MLLLDLHKALRNFRNFADCPYTSVNKDEIKLDDTLVGLIKKSPLTRIYEMTKWYRSYNEFLTSLQLNWSVSLAGLECKDYPYFELINHAYGYKVKVKLSFIAEFINKKDVYDTYVIKDILRDGKDFEIKRFETYIKADFEKIKMLKKELNND